MIRINATRRDAVASDSVVNHENIFLAKWQDSESTTRACRRLQATRIHIIAHQA
jgi:hypothetical protein